MRETTTLYAIYNGALLLASPLLATGLALRVLRGKSRDGWQERWGHTPALPETASGTIWFHAASVGEAMAIGPILHKLRERLPEHRLVLSTITPGGREIADGYVGKCIDAALYSPFDVPWAVNRTLRAVHPSVLVVVETELWPNLLELAHRAGARSILINGRISDRSFGRYRRAAWFFRMVLDRFDRILAQTETDAERLRTIGGEPQRVASAGNVKFDQAPDRLAPTEIEDLRRDLHLPAGAPVMIVGSTRSADEERVVLQAYRSLLVEVPNLALVHAPRHIDRASEVVDLMRAEGLAPVRRTEMSPASGPAQQIVLDTFGELGRVYAVADVVFIGNSLTPPGGGQNPLQPLVHGKPVLFGPYMQNFRDIAAMAESEHVGFRVVDAADLARKAHTLIADTDGRRQIETAAVHLIDRNRGAADRYVEEIVRLANSGPTHTV